MKLRILFLFLIVLTFNSCSKELDQPTSLLTQVIKFYEGLEVVETTAFAASAEDVDISNTTYIYFYPVEGATNFQYFQTSSANKNPQNLSNYNVRDFEIEDVFDGTLKRFVRTETNDVYSIITYQADGKFYISLPLEFKDQRQRTSYSSVVNVDQTQSLMPKFTWTNSAFSANELYHQVVSDANNQFLTGTYTLAKQFQYGSASNVVNSINPGVIPDLILNDDYNFTLFAIDGNYWVNSIIEEQFTAQ